MENSSKAVRRLFDYVTPMEKRFLRGIPSLIDIEMEINNFKIFSDGHEFSKFRRFRMGEVVSNRGIAVGYHSFTIMNNANATPYERKFIDMGAGLNYVYFKKLFVHPERRNMGVGTKLVSNALNLAKGLGKHSIADVERDNYLMANILTQQEFQNDFEWSAPSGVGMIRFYHD